MSSPYKKLKVGRAAGYPVVVKQGRGEHEAILLGCDDDPHAYLSRILAVDGKVKIRWSVAGYNDTAPASSVRLRQQLGGPSVPTSVPDAVSSSITVKTEETVFDKDTDDEDEADGMKPLAVTSGIAVKTEEDAYEARTDDEDDQHKHKPNDATDEGNEGPSALSDAEEFEVDGSLRIPRVECTSDAFFRFLPRLGVRDIICWALRTETTVRLAKIEQRYGNGDEREDSYSKVLASKYLIDVYPENDSEGTKSNAAGVGHDEYIFYMFSRKAHPQLTSIEFVDDYCRDNDYGGLTPILENGRELWDGRPDRQSVRGGKAVVPPTMLHFEILLEAYCGYNLSANGSWDGERRGLRDGRRNTPSCFNSPDPSCPRSAVMGGAVVAALASYQDKEVNAAFRACPMFDDTGDNLHEGEEIYWEALEALIHELHNYFLSNDQNRKEDVDKWGMPIQRHVATSTPFAKGDVDVFLQASPLARQVRGVLEANGISGANPDVLELIGSFVGNAGICENDLERYATLAIGDNGAIVAPKDTQFGFARSKHAISFILGKEDVRYDDHEYRGKLWPRTSQFIMLDPQADLLGGLLDFDQSIVACSYDGVSVRIAPRAALSLMTKANFVTPFCFEEHRNKKRVQKYSRRGFRPFIVDPNDNGTVQNLSCNAVIPRKTFAPPTNVDYLVSNEHYEIMRIQDEKMDDEFRVLCCHELAAVDGEGEEHVTYRQLGHDPRKLFRNDPAYTQMMFERSPGDAIDFFRQRFNWSDDDVRAVNAIDPYMRMACQKCKAEYNLIRVVMAIFPGLLHEYDLEDDNLRGEFSYMHTSGTESSPMYQPSFYSGGVFDSSFVRENARPVDKIESMLHSQSIFEVSSYVMKHGSPEGYLKRFVHSKELKTVFQKACKTLLRTPARPTVGLNPERFIERCANCQNWLLGNRYGSKECTRCGRER